MKICPYLGLPHDPQTPALFPSERNFCHRVRPPQAILASHQQAYCLVAEHQSCPVFGDPQIATRREFIPAPSSLEKYRIAAPVLIGLLFLAVLLFFGWNFRAFLSSPAPTVIPEAPQAAAPLAPAGTPEPQGPGEAVTEATPILSPRPSPTLPPPTETASLTPPASLETLIGENPALLIHRVARGESLTSLADRYGTTPEAIQAVNFVMPLPLWLDWLVVIPVDLQDASGLPRFEVYQVGEADSTLDALAEQQSVDVSLVARYNQLSPTDALTAGSWLLLPRP